MKIRNGFVSNSSSSSFIVLGVYSNDDTEIEGLDSVYIETSKYEYAKGIVIADTDEFYDIEDFDISGKIEEVSNLLGIDKSEIKLIYGSRPC